MRPNLSGIASFATLAASLLLGACSTQVPDDVVPVYNPTLTSAYVKTGDSVHDRDEAEALCRDTANALPAKRDWWGYALMGADSYILAPVGVLVGVHNDDTNIERNREAIIVRCIDGEKIIAWKPRENEGTSAQKGTVTASRPSEAPKI
jgi:hypothetical protein